MLPFFIIQKISTTSYNKRFRKTRKKNVLKIETNNVEFFDILQMYELHDGIIVKVRDCEYEAF